MIYYVAPPFTPEEGGGLAPGQPIHPELPPSGVRNPSPGMMPMREPWLSPTAAIRTLANSRTP